MVTQKHHLTGLMRNKDNKLTHRHTHNYFNIHSHTKFKYLHKYINKFVQRLIHINNPQKLNKKVHPNILWHKQKNKAKHKPMKKTKIQTHKYRNTQLYPASYSEKTITKWYTHTNTYTQT